MSLFAKESKRCVLIFSIEIYETEESFSLNTCSNSSLIELVFETYICPSQLHETVKLSILSIRADLEKLHDPSNPTSLTAS